MAKNQIAEYDIIVVGGGMVGAAFAAAVGGTGLKIAVIEASEIDFDWPENSHDIRVSAISHASQHLFENLGCWHNMVNEGVAAYRQMHVWDATGQGEIHFDSIEIGQLNLGYIIENRIIQKALWERLYGFDNIQLFMPTKLNAIDFNATGAVLTTTTGQQFNTRLVVAADGANSWVRNQANIALRSWAYHQAAVVCTVKTSQSHQDACWQQFMPEGPLAFLPLADGQSSIVWSTGEQQAEHLVNLDQQLFNQELQMAFGSSLGRIEVTSERAAFPLRLRHASQYVKEHLALIGDAAHTVHPLAGQGVNLGLLDAMVLAEEVQSASNRKRDIGGLTALRRYERRRKADNMAMLAAMDGFKRLFSNNIAPLKLIRNTGLNLVDQSGFLKNTLIKRAMGLTGELPELARRL